MERGIFFFMIRTFGGEQRGRGVVESGFGFGEQIRGMLGDELSGDEAVVQAQTRPCVDGGVLLLWNGERFGFPVAEPLPFGYSLLKDNAVDALQAAVNDAVRTHKLLKVNEPFGHKFTYAVKNEEVVFERKADFSDVGVLNELFQVFGKSRFIDAEEVAPCVGRDLNKCHFVGAPFVK